MVIQHHKFINTCTLVKDAWREQLVGIKSVISSLDSVSRLNPCAVK